MDIWKRICIFIYQPWGDDLSGRRLLACFSYSIFLSLLTGMKFLYTVPRRHFISPNKHQKDLRGVRNLWITRYYNPTIWGKNRWEKQYSSSSEKKKNISITLAVKLGFHLSAWLLISEKAPQSECLLQWKQRRAKKRIRFRKQSVKGMCHAGCN